MHTPVVSHCVLTMLFLVCQCSVCCAQALWPNPVVVDFSPQCPFVRLVVPIHGVDTPAAICGRSKVVIRG